MTTPLILYAFAALLAVLFLIVAAGRIARMTGLAKRQANTRLHVEESLALDGKRRLLLVRCDRRQVLLLTGSQDLVVGWLAEPQADEAVA